MVCGIRKVVLDIRIRKTSDDVSRSGIRKGSKPRNMKGSCETGTGLQNKKGGIGHQNKKDFG